MNEFKQSRKIDYFESVKIIKEVVENVMPGYSVDVSPFMYFCSETFTPHTLIRLTNSQGSKILKVPKEIELEDDLSEKNDEDILLTNLKNYEEVQLSEATQKIHFSKYDDDELVCFFETGNLKQYPLDEIEKLTGLKVYQDHPIEIINGDPIPASTRQFDTIESLVEYVKNDSNIVGIYHLPVKKQGGIMCRLLAKSNGASVIKGSVEQILETLKNKFTVDDTGKPGTIRFVEPEIPPFDVQLKTFVEKGETKGFLFFMETPIIQDDNQLKIEFSKISFKIL